jgi:hypothetical protein
VVGALNVTGLMLLTMVHRVAPVEAMGASGGVFGGVSNTLSGFGPLLVGFVAAAHGFGAGLGLMALILAIPIVCTAFLLREGY